MYKQSSPSIAYTMVFKKVATRLGFFEKVKFFLNHFVVKEKQESRIEKIAGQGL